MALEAIVVGAGPAGIATILQLADRFGLEYLGWIDPDFAVGRIGPHYRNVPSNTKVDLFLKFATCTHTGKQLVSNCDPFKQMAHLDPQKECQLSYVADLLKELSDKLCSHVKVCLKDSVTFISYSSDTNMWSVKCEYFSDLRVLAKRVIFCTGSHPKMLSAHVGTSAEVISLDVALDPYQLEYTIKHPTTERICVVGSSHSAVLVLKNLSDLGVPSIKMIYRSPLKFAVYQDDGTILNDNTGLKGQAAEWARNHLNRSVVPVPLNSATADTVLKEELSRCTKVVYAIGFEPNKIPKVYVDGDSFKIKSDGKSGKLSDLPGLYGFGIAFPEIIRDSEYNVGMWKFMSFIQKVVASM